MQYWKGQRVLVNGIAFGTVYQDQGLDQTVKITLDRRKNVIESVDPKTLSLVVTPAEEATMTDWLNRRYWP